MDENTLLVEQVNYYFAQWKLKNMISKTDW